MNDSWRAAIMDCAILLPWAVFIGVAVLGDAETPRTSGEQPDGSAAAIPVSLWIAVIPLLAYLFPRTCGVFHTLDVASRTVMVPRTRAHRLIASAMGFAVLTFSLLAQIRDPQ